MVDCQFLNKMVNLMVYTKVVFLKVNANDG